jgi:antirestriction protein
METVAVSTPRAWVGCLGCYNNGKLVGAWLDREQADTPELGGLAREMVGQFGSLFGCVVCGSDEFWCFDVENLPMASEMSPAEFVRHAERDEELDEHHSSDAVRIFIDHMGYNLRDLDLDIDEVFMAFGDAFVGEWSCVEDFAYETASEQGDLGGVAEYISDCIDFERVWESHLRFDYWEESGYFFRNI